MGRGGSREVSQQKQLYQQFNVVLSGCAWALPGSLGGLRNTPECPKGTESRETAIPSHAGCLSLVGCGLCYCWASLKGCEPAARKEFAPWPSPQC